MNRISPNFGVEVDVTVVAMWRAFLRRWGHRQRVHLALARAWGRNAEKTMTTRISQTGRK